MSKIVIVPIPVIKKTWKARKAIAGVLNNTLLGDPLVPIEEGETEEPSVAAALVFPAVAFMLGCFLLYIFERWRCVSTSTSPDGGSGKCSCAPCLAC